jgi:hypothetical protein
MLIFGSDIHGLTGVAGVSWSWFGARDAGRAGTARGFSTDQRQDYQAWIDNDRRLRDLLSQLEELGADALSSDPRWNRRTRPAGNQTRQTSS